MSPPVRRTHFPLGQLPEGKEQRGEGDVLAVVVGDDDGGRVDLGDVGEIDERRDLLVAGLGAGHDEAVAAVVAVQRLVVVDGAGVLAPQLDLVEVELGRLEVALGHVDEVGVHGEAVEVPRAIGELVHAGELVAGQRAVRSASGSAK